MYYACGRVVRTTTTAAKMALHYRFSELPREEKHTKAALIIKDCCIKNAGVYIKLGQLLATLEVIVPQEYTEVLKSMYEHAPVSSPAEIRTTIEREFGCKLESVFSEFDWAPISSASIAQVHRATLRETGQSVAVKVQHDWLKEQLPIDIKLTTALVIIGEALFPDELNFRWILYDLEKEMPKELNFKIEAQNSQNIQRCFADDPRIKIPDVYPKYLTERVMIQEYITNMVPRLPFSLLNNFLDKHRQEARPHSEQIQPERDCKYALGLFYETNIPFWDCPRRPSRGECFCKKIAHQRQDTAGPNRPWCGKIPFP